MTTNDVSTTVDPDPGHYPCDHCPLEGFEPVRAAVIQLHGVWLCKHHHDTVEVLQGMVLVPKGLRDADAAAAGQARVDILNKHNEQADAKRLERWYQSAYGAETLVSVHRQLVTLAENLSAVVPPDHVQYISKTDAAMEIRAMAFELQVWGEKLTVAYDAAQAAIKRVVDAKKADNGPEGGD